MNTRLLKTTETSTAAVPQEICLDTKNLTDSNHTEVTGYILSVDLDTLKQKLMRAKCKCIVDADEIVIYSSCNTMTTLDCRKKKSDAVFFSASWFLKTYFICTTGYSCGNVWRSIR